MKNRTYHLEHIEGGVNSGFADLDHILQKFKPAELVIVGARPSMGKSILLQNIAYNLTAQENKQVVFFTLGEPIEKMALRLLSAESSIPLSRLFKKGLSLPEKKKCHPLLESIIKRPIHFNDSGTLSIGEIYNKSRALNKNKNIDLIIIDQLQLISLGAQYKNLAEKDTRITQQLKALAIELNIPVILSSQINRDLENREEKRPILSDLRNSGRAEQIADVVIFIYRDEIYHEDSESKGVTELNTARNRHGATGTILLRLNGQYQRFEPYYPE